MHSTTRSRRALGALALTIAASGTLAVEAGAHARIYPTTVAEGAGGAYTLVAPNESDKASITEVSLEVPEGVLVGGLITEGGWSFETESAGEGHEATISKVTWIGGKAPVGEAAYLRFTARPDEEQTGTPTEYVFNVVETYDDGTVAEWTGPEDSEGPAPVVKIIAASGGGDTAVASPAAETADDESDDDGGSTGTIALIVAILALLLGVAGLVRRGGRSLT